MPDALRRGPGAVDPRLLRPDAVTLILPGAPRTKKNRGKIWKAGTRTIIMPAAPWMRWRDAVRLHAAFHGWGRYAPLACPLNCAAVFYRDRNSGDAVGYYQGLADVLEEVGVVADDKYITQWDGSRLALDRDNPRVELTLTPLP